MRLLVISSVNWGDMWQRHQIFAKGLTHFGWEVTFIENTGFRNPCLRDSRRVVKMLRRVGRSTGSAVDDSVNVVTPTVMPPYGRLWRFLNENVFIPKLIAKLQHGRYDVVLLYLPSPTSMSIVDRLRSTILVFDCVANFEEHKDAPTGLADVYVRLLSRSDLILTDGPFLEELLAARHSHVKMLHQGVSQNFFNCRTRVPQSHRTACYFGTIDDRIDWEAINQLLDYGVEVEMIGAVKSPVKAQIKVHSPVRHDQLVENLERYDCLLIPYRNEPFNNGIIPAKLFECLATGKPTLVSNLPYTKSFNEVLYVCNTPEQFVHSFNNLDNVETMGKINTRRELAKTFSDDYTIKELDSLLRQIVQAKSNA